MAAKKNYTYVWVSLIILVFGILTVPRLVERFTGGDIIENDRMSAENDPNRLAYVVLNGERAKAPGFALMNQDSLLVTEADFGGKVYVAEFFFTTCPTICPVMTKNLVSLQNTFKDSPDFGIASFSINPRYDTPGVLKAYAEKYGIDKLEWHLLTGEQDAIHKLANEGYSIFATQMDEAPGGFEHSGLFALVDKEGFIRSRKDQFGNPIVYYRGAILEGKGKNREGETEQIGILREDIKKLLEE
ncbi:SCO family protein [Sediminicola luteus]|uniref:SCO family protein n=1 Tax=Sediminicola luteus TaxID=319238 RepID=A0A2A4G5I8_9FLAO|nr:SCO family protein [Sediminicola luteus]PCE63246.1 SCO family protein [Sediminicola luteus]